MKTLLSILFLLVMLGTAGAEGLLVGSSDPSKAQTIEQNVRILELERQVRRKAGTQWLVTTDGNMKIRQDKVVACRVVDINEMWGFKLPKDVQGGQTVAPGPVLVGNAVEVYFANEWHEVKRYLMPESQWHRYDGADQRMRPDKRETNKTKQRAYDWMVSRCR